MATCTETRTPTSVGGPLSDVPTGQVVSGTPTLLTVGNNTVNQKIYTTASIAPAANALITIAVLGHNSTAAPPSPTVTGAEAYSLTCRVPSERARIPSPPGCPLRRGIAR